MRRIVLDVVDMLRTSPRFEMVIERSILNQLAASHTLDWFNLSMFLTAVTLEYIIP
jgi:hypothetical protein